MSAIFKRVFGSSADGKFGTFAGVFTPSVLTILGVIMYLRLGWVVGHAGLLGALTIVLIAHAITVVTGLSISAIATNRTVGTGGAYFMLSRSLGAEVGGAIGVSLFLAQALSFSLYVMGFTEALVSVAPGLPPRIVASVVCVALTVVSLWSADIAIKAQYVVMLVIGLSLVSFVIAGYGTGHEVALWSTDTPLAGRVGFAAVFAVFFPAVTGITAGISMSGDLRDARRSIPRGTMGAIAVGLVVYLGLPILLAVKAPGAMLRSDLQIMRHLSWIPLLVLLGIWGATLSSAIGSVLGAPHTLQALAHDRVVPRFLWKGARPHGHAADRDPAHFCSGRGRDPARRPQSHCPHSHDALPGHVRDAQPGVRPGAVGQLPELPPRPPGPGVDLLPRRRGLLLHDARYRGEPEMT